VGQLKPFFPLTSSFFGLIPEFKTSLLEEIFICTQHLNGFTYTDVLKLPVYERRFYLSLLMRQAKKRDEQSEQNKNNKGGKTTRISGEALKTKLKSGEIPNK
jgi:hypothetical protein